MQLCEQLQVWAEAFFPALSKEDALHEVKAVVLEALSWHALDLLYHLKAPIALEECLQVEAFLQRRAAGEPLSRIRGTKGFWKYTFEVSPDTLDPRPETEGIVEQALGFFQDRSPPQTILDLGTGSGCLLVSLLLEFPQAWGIGVDISQAALKIAQHNAASLGVSKRASWLCGHWADMLELSPHMDLIVSNPPYIETAEISALSPEVRCYDPPLALDGGADGLACYRHLIPQAAQLLSPQGCLLLEIGNTQGAAVQALLTPFFQHIHVIQDLSGHNRIVLSKRILTK
ncbi:MAG: peptide chain release factor N(5)-glutamine methyltransferase [Alphaproteobacteria bacterium]